jgi:hypothetical protein
VLRARAAAPTLTNTDLSPHSVVDGPALDSLEISGWRFDEVRPLHGVSGLLGGMSLSGSCSMATVRSARSILSGVVARSPAGSWHIESVGRSLVARPADTGNVIAAYYPRRIRMGGSVVLSEDDWFTLVRSPLSNDWRVLDRDRNELLRLEWCKPRGAGRFAIPIELSLVIPSKSSDEVTITVRTLLAVYVVFTQPGIRQTAPSG